MEKEDITFLYEFDPKRGTRRVYASLVEALRKEDITFLYEFDPKRGTRRVYASLVEALRTPGAVIFFDEINTLPTSLVKMLNPLFDYRRRLILPQCPGETGWYPLKWRMRSNSSLKSLK